MPEGLGVKADGVDVGGNHAPTHHTISSDRSMSFSEFVDKLPRSTLGIWRQEEVMGQS